MGPKRLLDSISMSKAPVSELLIMIGLFCLWMYSLDAAGHFRSSNVPISKICIDCQEIVAACHFKHPISSKFEAIKMDNLKANFFKVQSFHKVLFGAICLLLVVFL